MNTSDLDYTLPERLIAQRPADRRDASRLLVVDRARQSFQEDVFSNIGRYLRVGDCLAVNDTRVIRARLRGTKTTGGKVEIFLLRERAAGRWEALVRPSAKLKAGSRVNLPGGLSAEAGAILPEGRREVVFDRPDVLAIMESAGEIPLPPYIARDREDPADAERYQTVYNRAPGAVAAPTAGLHYTESLLAELEAKGVRRCALTLHVGYGTFKPISVAQLEDHTVDEEEYEVTPATAAMLNDSRNSGGRIVAVGTTSARVLESCVRTGIIESGTGRTALYIYPGYAFRTIDALQTNFHLPRSSLMALVAAFAGPKLILEAYQYAVSKEFRFYSYGDTMLIV